MKQFIQFDHEKLDVYRLELEFITWVSILLTEMSEQRGRRVAEVFDQLDRASLSSLLNTAEGNGKRQRPVRVRRPGPKPCKTTGLKTAQFS